MNQFAQPAFIAAISRCAREGWFDAAAKPASRLTLRIGQRVGRKQPLAADCADSARDGEHGVEAFLANRETRNLHQRSAADAAIGRKQDGEETFSNLADPTPTDRRPVTAGSNRRACHCSFGLASPNSVPTTAEDGLRVARRNLAWAGDFAIACCNRV